MIRALIQYLGVFCCMLGGTGYAKAQFQEGTGKIDFFGLFVSSRKTLIRVSLIVWLIGGAITYLVAPDL